MFPRDFFKRHSGQDFEQWIKLGLSAFDIELTTEAKDMARADVGSAADGGGGSSSAVIRLGSGGIGRMSGDGSTGGPPGRTSSTGTAAP